MILHDTGYKLQCNVYLKSDNENEGPTLPVVNAITCVEIDNEEPFLLLMNQFYYYDHDEQDESLCHRYQAIEHGVSFFLTPSNKLTPDCDVSKQKMVIEGQEIQLKYKTART